MAKTRDLINVDSDNWGVVVARVNELLDDLATEVITANTDTGGGVTVGNAYITGILGATTLVANTIRGGTISTPAPMNIGSNAIFDVTKALINGNITINSTAVAIGNLVLTPTTFLAGNSTVNSLANSTFYSMANASVSANMSLTGFKIGDSTVNATGVYVGANVLVNATTIFMGNATVNTVIIPTLITLGGNLSLNSSALGIGNSVANTTLSATQSYMGNSTFFTTVVPGEIRVGNSTVNAVINSMGLTAGLQILNDITLGNSTINVHVNTTTMAIGSNVVVNGSSYFVGNDSVFTLITNSSIQTAQTYMTNTALGVGTTPASMPSVFFANLTTMSIGNSTVNTVVNNSTLAIRGIVQATINVITTGTTAQLVDSWTMAGYQSAEYTFSIKNNSANGYHFTKVAIIHDSVNAHVTEYATMITNSSLGTFSANANTTHIALYVTPIPAATSIKGTVTRFGV